MKNKVIKYFIIIIATIFTIIVIQCHGGSDVGETINPPIETSTTGTTYSLTNSYASSISTNTSNTTSTLSSGETSSPSTSVSTFSSVTSSTSGGSTTESTGTTNQQPSAQIISPLNTACLINNTVIITGTASDVDGTIASIDLRIDNVSTTVSGIAGWTATSSILANGLHSISLIVFDNIGSGSISQIISITVDNTQTLIGLVSSNSIMTTCSYNIPLSGTYSISNCSSPGTIQYRINSGLWNGIGYMNSLTWSNSNITSGLNSGYNTIRLRITDNFSNTNSTIVLVNIINNTSSIYNLNLNNNSVTSSYLSSGFIIGTASDNDGISKVEYCFDGGSWLSATGTTNWKLKVPVSSSAIISGTNKWQDYTKHTIIYRITDDCGIISTSSAFKFIKGTNKDYNGDGYSDAIVGAYGANVTSTDSGEAFIYLGGTNMNNGADVTFLGVSNSDIFGYSVASAGDVNGDGYADAIIGAPWTDITYPNCGKAFLYYGSSSMDNVADVIFSGASTSDTLGMSVCTAGDVNGDGYADVIIGLMGANSGGSSRGGVRIYYGGISMNNVADITIAGSNNNDYLGVSVAGAGDVNGDGYSDVVVGAYNAGTIHSGQAYVYYGGSSMDLTRDLTITGTSGGDTLGWCVSSAGDVNGDGYADVIVGATGVAGGGTQRGQAYIFLGGVSMINEADIIITGSADYDNLGRGVGNCGDVNGDGYTEIIIGAIYADVSSTNVGQAYLYYGGNSMNNTVDVIFSGANNDDYLGAGVSSCGDVNGDGFADVIVGAYNANNGRASIYYGEINMNNIADVIFTGLASSDYLGYSVN